MEYTRKEKEYLPVLAICYDFDKTQTLAIIKPDGMRNIASILDMIYKSGLNVERFKLKRLSDEELEEHYSHIKDKPFYPKLRYYMKSGIVALMILRGENAVERFRDLMGPTDSKKAGKDTIRGKFGTDITYNAVHGSDSPISAYEEINRFFGEELEKDISKQKRIKF